MSHSYGSLSRPSFGNSTAYISFLRSEIVAKQELSVHDAWAALSKPDHSVPDHSPLDHNLSDHVL